MEAMYSSVRSCGEWQFGECRMAITEVRRGNTCDRWALLDAFGPCGWLRVRLDESTSSATVTCYRRSGDKWVVVMESALSLGDDYGDDGEMEPEDG